MAELTVNSEKQKRSIHFTDELITIGRSRTCTITVPDVNAEDVHCRISKSGNAYKLVDAGSRLGTFVNGTKVAHHILSEGDTIRIGKLELSFSKKGFPAAPRREGAVSLHDSARIRAIKEPKNISMLKKTALPKNVRKKLEETTFALSDLTIVIEALIEQGGAGAMDEIYETVDQYNRKLTGASKIDDLLELRENLLRLLEINKLLNCEHDLKKLIDMVMDTLIGMTSAERGFLILKERETLVIKTARNFDKESLQNPEFKFSRSIAEEVMKTGRPIVSADAGKDASLPASISVENLQLRSLICVPFKVKESIIGCLYLDNRFERGLFLESDLVVIQGFADQAAIAIENARLYETVVRQREELQRSASEIDKVNKALQTKVETQTNELNNVRETLRSKQELIGMSYDYSSIIGRSAPMQEVLRLIDRVIKSEEPALIVGESGTGKELIARAIHYNGKRKDAPFVAVNCAAVTPSLLESEIFGHEKGAFTGAVGVRKGLFETAHGGTLFLDEIGNMSMEMQQKLLRVVELGEFRRIGGNETKKADVRLISASNRDIVELVKGGAFREDFMYRINVMTIKLPALRERREDIPLLIDHFLSKIAKELREAKLVLGDGVLSILQDYDWPGNVRELENEIRKCAALSDKVIERDALKDEIKSREILRSSISPSAGSALKASVREAVAQVEKAIILKALEETDWTKVEAAKLLGVSRPTLDAKMVEYAITRPVK